MQKGVPQTSTLPRLGFLMRAAQNVRNGPLNDYTGISVKINCIPNEPLSACRNYVLIPSYFKLNKKKSHGELKIISFKRIHMFLYDVIEHSQILSPKAMFNTQNYKKAHAMTFCHSMSWHSVNSKERISLTFFQLQRSQIFWKKSENILKHTMEYRLVLYDIFFAQRLF